jgi:hypothetical protein
MIKPTYSRFWADFILFFISIRMKLHFQKMVFDGNFTDNGKPVLLISNHFSWWDGFIQAVLNRRFFGRKMYFMMLEEELRKRLFLRKAGAFSVARGTRGIVDSLQFSVDLLGKSENLLLLFPQGKIQSMHIRQIRLEKGLDFILKRMGENGQVVFNVNLVDYFSFKKPVLNIYFENYTSPGGYVFETLADDFQLFYEKCRAKQLQP